MDFSLGVYHSNRNKTRTRATEDTQCCPLTRVHNRHKHVHISHTHRERDMKHMHMESRVYRHEGYDLSLLRM